MQTPESIRAILEQIEYRDWSFRLGVEAGAAWVQCVFSDSESGAIQHGRKWRISMAATDGEIVQTVLAAVLAAEEHEARERFRFAGLAIFHPHHRLEDLIEIAARTETRAARRADGL